MQIVQSFVSEIVNMIIGFFSAPGFSTSLLIAPFVLWLIRQVLVYFKLIIWSLFK